MKHMLNINKVKQGKNDKNTLPAINRGREGLVRL